MDSADPMLWIIEGLALGVASLLLRGPWDGGAWGAPEPPRDPDEPLHRP